MTPILNKSLRAGLMIACGALFVACSSDSGEDTSGAAAVDLPKGLSLVMLNASTGAYYLFDTDTNTRTDLNDQAQRSQDSAVQKLLISDTSTIGHFFSWPDFRMVNGQERLDDKYLLLKPTYVPGSAIDSTKFVQLTHFHDGTLAAHSADEFANPEPGSNKAAGLTRLNNHVAAQAELEEEVASVLPAGETLCRAYIDPYLKFEEEHAGAKSSDHAHGDLAHMALTTTGRMYFFAENETGLAQSQGFVKLDNVNTIADCTRATISRASDDGVLVFIPDTQRLYLVDSHGGDFHQHSTWHISAVLPRGLRADLLTVLGDGGEHEH